MNHLCFLTFLSSIRKRWSTTFVTSFGRRWLPLPARRLVSDGPERFFCTHSLEVDQTSHQLLFHRNNDNILYTIRALQQHHRCSGPLISSVNQFVAQLAGHSLTESQSLSFFAMLSVKACPPVRILCLTNFGVFSCICSEKLWHSCSG